MAINIKIKINNIIIICIFMLCITLPLVFFHGEEGRRSYVENKMSEKKPELAGVSIWSSQYTSKIETYVNDRIGLRDELILANIGFMDTFFKDFEVTNVIEGKNHHTFYMNSNIMSCYQGTDNIIEEQMDEIAEIFAFVNTSFNAASINFVFAPIPNKDGIYGEYMPDDIYVMSDKSMLKSVKSYLKENGIISVADIYSALENAKSETELLYYRNYDASHWNRYGCLYGFFELLDTLEEDYQDSIFRYRGFEDWNIRREDIHYAAEYIQRYKIIEWTFRDMEDYMYNVVPKKGYTYETIGNDYGYTHLHNDSVNYSRTLCIIGDSYISSFMLPYLAETFSDVYFAHHASSEELIVQMISDAVPDYFVYSVVERMTNYDNVSEVAQKLINAAFNFQLKDGSACMARNLTDQNWTNGLLNGDKRVVLFGKFNNLAEFLPGTKMVLENGKQVIIEDMRETNIDYIVTCNIDNLNDEEFELLKWPHVIKIMAEE